MDTKLFDTRLINFDSILSDRKNAVNIVVYYRYLLGLSSALILFFFRKTLPFPFPHFFLVTILFLFCNTILHAFSQRKGHGNTLDLYSYYLDTMMVPLVMYCSGGFLSSLIVIHAITAVGVSTVYPGRKRAIQSVYIFVIASYTGVALLQKYGLLANHVLYSRRMMDNTVFFYLVVFFIDSIIGLSYFVIKKSHENRTKMINSLKNAYENVVKGMADDVGVNLFQRLVLHLADAVQTRYVFIGMFDSKNDSKIVPLTFWDGDFSDSLESFPVKNSVFERVIAEKRYFCSTDVQKEFPDDKFLKLLKAESFYGITLYSADKVPIGVICTVHDAEMVTDYIIRSVFKIFASRTAAEVERIRNEAENRKIQEQLTQSQKLEALGQLAGGIAHDFNNILNGIMGYSQLMQMKLEEKSPLKIYPEKIVALSKKASALTSQLLTFARKGKYHLVSIDIHKSIAEVSNMLEHTLDKSISIKQKLHSARKTVIGDPSQLENMLINLAVNARDAMPDGGELVLGTESILIDEAFIREHAFANKCKSGDYLIVTVSDNGKGMDNETMLRIFEPFFTTKKIGKGTGLGLAAVYGCIENHNGCIDVESRENEGATFRIYLPLAKKEAQNGRDTQTFIREIKGRGAYILLVDDEEDILDSLSESLSLYGYNVKTCQDGVIAVDYFKENFNVIDLVILDMNMPIMSGKQVFHEMKEIDPEVKVLIATGYTFEADARKLLAEEGVIDLVSKPFRPDKLVGAIEKIFSEASPAE